MNGTGIRTFFARSVSSLVPNSGERVADLIDRFSQTPSHLASPAAVYWIDLVNRASPIRVYPVPVVSPIT